MDGAGGRTPVIEPHAAVIAVASILLIRHSNIFLLCRPRVMEFPPSSLARSVNTISQLHSHILHGMKRKGQRISDEVSRRFRSGS